jgi:hypothetical protein
MTVDRYTELKN